MNEKKIIEKIKKVLELSRNNPSEAEAKAAAMKAQKLMAEYHISMARIDENDDPGNITEKAMTVGTGNKWKYQLAQIVAKNFRCKTLCYGKSGIAFYGYEVDAEIALETFKFLFETGCKAANSYYNKLRNGSIGSGEYFCGKGIKNCFLVGYLEGIKEGLERQCTALMIIVPKEVKEKFTERTSGCKTIKSRLKTESYYGNQSREEGRRTGRDTISGRKIAMA